MLRVAVLLEQADERAGAGDKDVEVGEQVLDDEQRPAAIDAALVHIEQDAREEIGDEQNAHDPDQRGGDEHAPAVSHKGRLLFVLEVDEPEKAHQRRREEVDLLCRQGRGGAVGQKAAAHHDIERVGQEKDGLGGDRHGEIPLRDHFGQPGGAVADDADQKGRDQVDLQIKQRVSHLCIHKQLSTIRRPRREDDQLPS